MPDFPLPVHQAGDLIDVPDAFLVDGYAVYAGTASGDPDTPAEPVLVIDLSGYLQVELAAAATLGDLGSPAPVRSIRLIIQEAGAHKISESMDRALQQLENVRRNQERPDA